MCLTVSEASPYHPGQDIRSALGKSHHMTDSDQYLGFALNGSAKQVFALCLGAKKTPSKDAASWG